MRRFFLLFGPFRVLFIIDDQDKKLFTFFTNKYKFYPFNENNKFVLEVKIYLKNSLYEAQITAKVQCITINAVKSRIYYLDTGIRNFIGLLLIQKNILLIHGSSVIYHNTAYIFTGRSGIGKSTMIRNFKANSIYGEETSIIQYDKNSHCFYLYPSSFDIVSRNTPQKKKKVRFFFILNKSQTVSFKQLSPNKAVQVLGNSIHWWVYHTLVLKKDRTNQGLNKNNHIVFINTINKLLMYLVLYVPIYQLSVPKTHNGPNTLSKIIRSHSVRS